MIVAILGEGDMPPKELTAVIDDLFDEAAAGLAPEDPVTYQFWIEMVPDPGPGHRKLLSHVKALGAPFDVFTRGPVPTEPGIYEGAGEVWSDCPYGAILTMLQDLARQGHDVRVLGMFCNPSTSDPRDAELEEAIEAWLRMGGDAYALNGAMYKFAVTDVLQPGAGLGHPIEPEALADMLGVEPEMAEALAEVEPTPAPATSYDDMKAGELRDLCKSRNLQPREWRAREALIEALMADDASVAPGEVRAYLHGEPTESYLTEAEVRELEADQDMEQIAADTGIPLDVLAAVDTVVDTIEPLRIYSGHTVDDIADAVVDRLFERIKELFK